MKPETAISAAAARAGMNMTETRLRGITDDVFKKFHGNAERALPTFWRMLRDDAECGQLAVTSFLRRAFDEKAGNKLRCAATSNSDRGGAGPYSDGSQKLSAAPCREPSANDREAARNAAHKITLTVFDSFKVRDGRGIGDVRWGQLATLRGADMMSAAVIDLLMKHTKAPHDMLVRDVVKMCDLQCMIQKAAETADVE